MPLTTFLCGENHPTQFGGEAPHPQKMWYLERIPFLSFLSLMSQKTSYCLQGGDKWYNEDREEDQHNERRLNMKRVLTVLLIAALVVLTGCSKKEAGGKNYDKVYFGSLYNELSSEDAAAAYDFMMDTINNHTSDFKPEDAIIGGQTISLIAELEGVRTNYAFLQQNLHVLKVEKNASGEYQIDESATKEYQIDEDYYNNEFYPFFSKLGDKYFPMYYQLTNGIERVGAATLVKDGETRELSADEMFNLYNVAMYIAANFGSFEKYEGSTDNALYKVIIDDKVVTEEIYFMPECIVVSGRKVVPPAELNVNIITD